LGAPGLIGLTGGIAAGKSEALAAFERHGAETISSDEVVHELLRAPELRSRLVERWGVEVAPGGELDRGRVAEIVFADPAELAWLEAQLHPGVGQRLVEWAARLPAGTRLAVVEVPLLFETGMEDLFDAVVSIVADDGVRRERAAGREISSLEGRTGRQLSQEQKAARATHVIHNDGSLAELDAKIGELVEALAERAARG
jgi:dephospho-CoA kinase